MNRGAMQMEMTRGEASLDDSLTVSAMASTVRERRSRDQGGSPDIDLSKVSARKISTRPPSFFPT